MMQPPWAFWMPTSLPHHLQTSLVNCLFLATLHRWPVSKTALSSIQHDSREIPSPGSQMWCGVEIDPRVSLRLIMLADSPPCTWAAFCNTWAAFYHRDALELPLKCQISQSSCLRHPAPSAFPGNVEMLGCYGSWQYVCTPCMYCPCKMLSNQIWIIVQIHLILRNLTPPPPSYIMFFGYVTKYSKCTKTCPWHANASPDGVSWRCLALVQEVPNMNLISVKVINLYICIPHVSLMHCLLVL